MAKPYLIQL